MVANLQTPDVLYLLHSRGGIMESGERETEVAKADLMTPLEHQLWGNTPR